MILKVVVIYLSCVLLMSNLYAKTSNCDAIVIDQRLPNVISTDMTLSSSIVYGIDRRVLVTNGATLTIEPGTTLAGCSLYSFLVVANDAKIMAKGTKSNPITFTSQLELHGFSKNETAPGEWGGLVIAGKAYTHYQNNKYEADESIEFGSDTHEHDADNSGVLEYVVIKHTGFEVKKDKELNGLSLAGIGSGTTIKNIAIIGGGDDGLEIWGGTVNIDGLYIYNASDDSLDVDLGYRGEVKNVLIIQKDVASINNHDSSAMEFGNDENLILTDTSNTTLPSVKNLTAYIVGGGIYNKFDAGFKLSNVKIVSQKTKEHEMVYFRGTDSYTTGAKYLLGDVCFSNKKKNLHLKDIFSKTNAKEPKNKYTAYNYFIKKHHEIGNGEFSMQDQCSNGVDENSIWRGGIKSEKN
ncbi:MAG TPA: hypothetical protein EYG70_04840 [Sulfurimonas sp.]|nr:hypothetical protein [Sulfurimonas sp.]